MVARNHRRRPPRSQTPVTMRPVSRPVRPNRRSDPRHVQVLKQTVWIEGTTQSNEAAAVIIEP